MDVYGDLLIAIQSGAPDARARIRSLANNGLREKSIVAGGVDRGPMRLNAEVLPAGLPLGGRLALNGHLVADSGPAALLGLSEFTSYVEEWIAICNAESRRIIEAEQAFFSRGGQSGLVAWYSGLLQRLEAVTPNQCLLRLGWGSGFDATGALNVQVLCRGLATIARGYAEWDRFQHGQAQERLSRGLRTLDPFAAGRFDETWTGFARQVHEHMEWLQTLKRPDGGTLRVADLVANAKRRGDLEARYDDAVARLYSALEMAARVRLAETYGIQTSRVRLDQVPAALREDYERRYRTPQGHLKLPQFAAYRLLAALRDDLGNRYAMREGDIEKLLGSRNNSILAHGEKPVAEQLYRQLCALTIEVAAVREADLPVFPNVAW